MISAQQRQVIKRCQKSVTFFLRNFGYTKHPTAGVIKFDPFHYQKSALAAFRKYRFTIFRKCRQSGVSKISGAFALWFAMFFSHKTVLIVSRTDDTAISFLAENIAFLFKHLPQWVQDLWRPTKENEHEFQFPNGSRIKSLTSHPDVLRSNASSLNIIDEAAFVHDMSILWAAGYPTLQHGGNIICVSTTNGVGDWYWSTWTDAEAKLNDFHPIMINWWDMDWVIKYKSALSGQLMEIAPTKDIRKCTTPEEIEKYGLYWSPWLEEQYRALQERGEAWKFKQEILAQFVGSGNTVLDQTVLTHIANGTSNEFKIVRGTHNYVHPVKNNPIVINFNGDDGRELDANEGLWVWNKPNLGRKPTTRGNRIIDLGEPPHRYTLGVDIATGKGRDYFAGEVFDVDEMEQAAEIMIRTIPMKFKYIIDYLGRWYNNATMVVERNNGGDAFIDELRIELMYPHLWRKMITNDKPHRSSRHNMVRLKIAEYGFMTTVASKPKLNKLLIDHLRPDSSSWRIHSTRLAKQLQIYVRKRDRTGRDTERTEAEDGPGNHDDLVMATGLALVGISEATSAGSDGLLPFHGAADSDIPPMSSPEKFAAFVDKATQMDSMCLVPMSGFTDTAPAEGVFAEIERFAKQLGATPIAQQMPNVSLRKHRL